jgi:hypothetical protein
MARGHGSSAPDAPPPEQVFRDLLGGVLRPMLERQPPDAVEAARRILVEAGAAIEAEVLLVEPPPRRRGRESRQRSRSPRRPWW